MLFLGVCAAGLSGRKSLARSIPENILNFAFALVDQFAITTAEMHTSEVRAVNVFITFWLLAVVVITSSYKAIMKSDYVLEPKYTMPWTSLKGMEGFSFIFPSDDAQMDEKFILKMKESCNIK